MIYFCYYVLKFDLWKILASDCTQTTRYRQTSWRIYKSRKATQFDSFRVQYTIDMKVKLSEEMFKKINVMYLILKLTIAKPILDSYARSVLFCGTWLFYMRFHIINIAPAISCIDIAIDTHQEWRVGCDGTLETVHIHYAKICDLDFH